MSRKFDMDDPSQRLYRGRWHVYRPRRPWKVYIGAAWWCVTFALNAAYVLEAFRAPRSPEPIAMLPFRSVLGGVVALACWELVAIVRRRERALQVFLVVLWGWMAMLAGRIIAAAWEGTWSLTGGWAASALLAANVVAKEWVSGVRRRPAGIGEVVR